MMFTSAPRISVLAAARSPEEGAVGVDTGVETAGVLVTTVVLVGVTTGFALAGTGFVVVAMGVVEEPSAGNESAGSATGVSAARPVELAPGVPLFSTTTVPLAKYPTKSTSTNTPSIAR
jgi:hypothetical protein